MYSTQDGSVRPPNSGMVASRLAAVAGPTTRIEQSTSVIRRKPVSASMASTRRTRAWRFRRNLRSGLGFRILFQAAGEGVVVDVVPLR